MHAQQSDDAFLSISHPLRAVPLQARLAPRRILVVDGCRVGLGDQFMYVAPVQALLGRFPEACVTFVTRHSDFWASRGDGRMNTCAPTDDHTQDLVRHLHNGFDFVIAGYSPGSLGACAESPVTTVFWAGYDLANIRCFVREDGTITEAPLRITQDCLIESDKFMAFLADVGIVEYTPPLVTNLLASSKDLSGNARPPLRDLAEARVLIHPSSAGPHKEWPVSSWAGVCRLLGEHGAQVVVSSGATPRDRQTAAALRETAPSAHVLDPMPLGAFLQSLAGFNFVLSGDTFITHAIAAQGGPISIAIFEQTDPLRFCPPTPHNFFLAPFRMSGQEYVDAMRFLLRLQNAAAEDQIEEPLGKSLCDALKGFKDHVLALMHSGENADLRTQIALDIVRCREVAPEGLRAFVVGADELIGRIVRALDRSPAHIALQYLDQSPLARCAGLLPPS